MSIQQNAIPRPLVRTNQWVIVLSVAAAWLTGSGWFLAIPLTAGILGLLFDYNPIMRAAKLFLRKQPSQYIPEDKAQQKFNQVIAVFCLLLSLAGFQLHWQTVAIVFSVMVGLAALIAILGFCVGCFIRYQWLRFSRGRKLHGHRS